MRKVFQAKELGIKILILNGLEVKNIASKGVSAPMNRAPGRPGLCLDLMNPV